MPHNSIVIIDMSVPNQRRLCTYESKLPNPCLERDPLNVQIFLKMHMSDYAKRWLKEMQNIDEDHTLTQLETAWQNLAVGGSKLQEAYLIFQDFSEKS
ncbi:putative coatomer, epsilon subunit protein [Rosa chinensis]|uniref:Putative coatomer, epsilon subunit protein n=1 Tax=Rosa chinensis TaxID=74649 RepID=A0A2P6PVM9_ROSCH|nr:putative coatomer, epsilon subunit protein [Rosa chinensis]